MDKKQVVELIASEGFSIKPNQVERIEILSERKSVNSAGTDLYEYVAHTKVGDFHIVEELVPNAYGATAFSTEKNLVLKGVEKNGTSYKEEDLEEEEEEIEESTTSDEPIEEM